MEEKVIQYRKDEHTEIISNDTVVNTRGNATYHVKIYHNKLNEYKYIKATDVDILESKLDKECMKLSEAWEHQEKILEVEQKNENLKKKIDAIKNILLTSASIDFNLDWNSLKSFEEYHESEPIKPEERKYKENSYNKPHYYKPVLSFSEKFIFKKKGKEIIEKSKLKHDQELEKYKQLEEKKRRDIDQFNKEQYSNWIAKLNLFTEEKEKFINDQNKHNCEIDDKRKKYEEGDCNTISEVIMTKLRNHNLSIFPDEFEVNYISNTKTIIIDYRLPDIDDISNIKSYRYVKKDKTITESNLTNKEFDILYDNALYSLIISRIYIIFGYDELDYIEAINLNGYIKNINKSSGKEQKLCIASIFIQKADFNEINLSQINAKECFKSFKGIASVKLATLTPVKPLIELNKDDSRFSDSYDVADSLNETTNLAAMDWEDFEHLIRELFAKEFTENGGEVKITQASRDGGVDAIAFDPDPIRGGKIVIQAKRYTNTVGVSAVRDLYGTVMNEGANKGIIVTTSDYGNDSYNFAKDKPLTLLNGANLLFLLEKHGHKAKIDINAAKSLL